MVRSFYLTPRLKSSEYITGALLSPEAARAGVHQSLRTSMWERMLDTSREDGTVTTNLALTWAVVSPFPAPPPSNQKLVLVL